jgi:hypothetical protein
MTPLDVRPVPINAIVPTGLYRRLGEPWWAGTTALAVISVASFLVVPDPVLLLAGAAVPLGGGAVFGYLDRSYWWAVVAVVAGWLVSAVVTTSQEGWDVGPVEDVFTVIFFGLFLAGETILGGLIGRRLAARAGRA